MNLSLITRLWLAFRAGKRISATVASKTTRGQAYSTGGLALAMGTGIALWNSYNPEAEISTEQAAAMCGVALTVLSPVLSRFLANVRKPGMILPDPMANVLKVKSAGDGYWQSVGSNLTAMDAQADGWDFAVTLRPDGDGDVLDLRTGKVVDLMRLPKPGQVGENND